MTMRQYLSHKRDCIFCQIIERKSPAKILWEWREVIAFEPLNPVVPNHTLIVPKFHVESFISDPIVSSKTMEAAAQYGAFFNSDVNLITSKGPDATQTIMHMHIHLVPRFSDDGLKLPWTP